MKPGLSLLGVALACTVGGLGLAGQLGPLGSQEETPDRRGQSWPPHPSQIINLTNHVRDGQSVGFCVRKNVFAPLYQVPKDQWLVVTDLVVEEWIPEEAGYIFLAQEKGGDFTMKLDNKFIGLSAPGPYHSQVGLVFEPGSTLGLWYPNRGGSDIFPKEILVEFAITGYLTQ